MIFPGWSSVNIFLHSVAVDKMFNSNTLKRLFLFTGGDIGGERGEWVEGDGEEEHGEEEWQGGGTGRKGYSGGGLKFCFQLSSESLSLSKVLLNLAQISSTDAILTEVLKIPNSSTDEMIFKVPLTKECFMARLGLPPGHFFNQADNNFPRILNLFVITALPIKVKLIFFSLSAI